MYMLPFFGLVLLPQYFADMQHGIYSEYVCMDSQVLQSGSWNSTLTILPAQSGYQEVLWKHFLVKHSSGGKLSSSNYAVARATHLVKHTVAAHHSSKGYRDAPLQLSECTLQNIKYRNSKNLACQHSNFFKQYTKHGIFVHTIF